MSLSNKHEFPQGTVLWKTAKTASMSQDQLFKLLVVGESGVGKTCILLRFADNSFDETFLSTIGVDFKVKELIMDGKKIRLQIWDSAGQERFRNITNSYYRNCSGIIIVYDITSHESFDKVTEWVSDVRKYVPTVPLLLVGNKCDKEDERQVTREEGEEQARKLGLVFLETSAKTSVNIDEAFKEMTKQLLNELAKKPKEASKTQQIELKKPSNESKGCCK